MQHAHAHSAPGCRPELHSPQSTRGNTTYWDLEDAPIPLCNALEADEGTVLRQAVP